MNITFKNWPGRFAFSARLNSMKRLVQKAIIGAAVASLCLHLSPLQVIALESAAAGPAVGLYSDGSIIVELDRLNASIRAPKEIHRAKYIFGLPRKAPDKRWMESDKIPIAHSQWETNGQRYTQTVLITRLNPGELVVEGHQPPDAVVLVQIKGENLNNVYSEGTAEFAVQVEGNELHLGLYDGLVRATNSPLPLAVVEIAAEGIATTNGFKLQFRGNVPPLHSGAMTIKIPLRKLDTTAEIDRLRELEFDEEVKRVKQFWNGPARKNPGLMLRFL